MTRTILLIGVFIVAGAAWADAPGKTKARARAKSAVAASAAAPAPTPLPPRPALDSLPPPVPGGVATQQASSDAPAPADQPR